MIYMKNFQFYLMNERLHVNDDIDLQSQKIYSNILKSNDSYFEFIDLPGSLNIIKLIIIIKDLPNNILGRLDVGKSKLTEEGWIIYIELKKDFKLYTLQHEMQHALRLTLIGKDAIIKNLNHIKSKGLLPIKNSEVDEFFNYLYLANDEEINAKIAETKGLLNEYRSIHGKINRITFENIIENSDGFRDAEYLINYNTDELFKSLTDNQLNKLFCIIEDKKGDLDNMDNFLVKLKIQFNIIKSLFYNTTADFYEHDYKTYKPIKNKNFYDKYITNQGEKLKKRMYALFVHFL